MQIGCPPETASLHVIRSKKKVPFHSKIDFSLNVMKVTFCKGLYIILNLIGRSDFKYLCFKDHFKMVKI